MPTVNQHTNRGMGKQESIQPHLHNNTAHAQTQKSRVGRGVHSVRQFYRVGRISCQVNFAVVNFAVGNFAETPECAVSTAVQEIFGSAWIRVGNFAANLKREIAHAKLKCCEIFSPPVHRVAQ